MKFLHIMCHKSPIFNAQTIELINDKLNKRDSSVFVSIDINLCKERNVDNLFYEENLVKYINENYKKFDYIFIHAMNFTPKQLLKIKRKAIKKFIWCIWGHDLYLPRDTLKNKLRYKLKSLILKNIYAVALGFYMDLFEVRKFIGYKSKCFFMPYGYESNTYDTYNKILIDQKQSNVLRVMVGHSAYQDLKHIDILKNLKRFKEKNIEILLVFSYRVEEYAQEVKKFVNDNFDKCQIVIINNLMSSVEYMKLLSTVDIALFGHKNQAALGNIWRLAFLGKKIYLPKESIVKQGFDLLGLNIHKLESIGKISYEEFCEPLDKRDIDKLHNYGELFVNENNILDAWKKTFDMLEENDE